MDAGPVRRDHRHDLEVLMEALIVLAIIALLAIFDVLAVRYGADSRILDNTRPNWW